MDWSKFLANGSSIWVGLDLMYDNGWINTWHLFITPGENISEFLEEGSVSCYLLRGAILTDMYVLDYTRFHRNVNGMNSCDISHIALGQHMEC